MTPPHLHEVLSAPRSAHTPAKRLVSTDLSRSQKSAGSWEGGGGRGNESGGRGGEK